MTPRLKELYYKEIQPALKSQFGFKNLYMGPKIEKIVLNMGLGLDGNDSKILKSCEEDLAKITGQKPVITKFKKSVANFKTRKGSNAGLKVTLRKDKMYELLEGSGIIIESVLMKSIQLPSGLAKSIEQKLQAEQDAMRMEFILKQEKLEADRKIIEAKGTRDAQKILAEGLTQEIIKLKSIEAFRELSKSPNSKVIVTDGKAPLLID